MLADMSDPAIVGPASKAGRPGSSADVPPVPVQVLSSAQASSVDRTPESGRLIQSGRTGRTRYRCRADRLDPSAGNGAPPETQGRHTGRGLAAALAQAVYAVSRPGSAVEPYECATLGYD